MAGVAVYFSNVFSGVSLSLAQQWLFQGVHMISRQTVLALLVHSPFRGSNTILTSIKGSCSCLQSLFLFSTLKGLWWGGHQAEISHVRGGLTRDLLVRKSVDAPFYWWKDWQGGRGAALRRALEVQHLNVSYTRASQCLVMRALPPLVHAASFGVFRVQAFLQAAW